MYVCEGLGKVFFLLCTKYKYRACFFKKKSWEWREESYSREGRAVAVFYLMEETGNREDLQDCFLQRGKFAVLIVGGTDPEVTHSTESCQNPWHLWPSFQLLHSPSFYKKQNKTKTNKQKSPPNNKLMKRWRH